MNLLLVLIALGRADRLREFLSSDSIEVVACYVPHPIRIKTSACAPRFFNTL